MPSRRTITINLYTINARSGDELLPYADLFSAVAARESSETIETISGDLSFAIDLREVEPDVKDGEATEQRVFLGHVVAGSPGEVPLYFDYTTGETVEGTTPEGKWLAQLSRITISVSSDSRYLALESTRNGVTPARLERYFTRLAESTLVNGRVEFDINPVQSPSLREEIESFERIREATAIVTRPNYDWTDMSNKLSGLADESSGHEAEATVRAARGDSLSKNNGLVGVILETLTSTSSSALKKFRITGRKPNSGRETTVTSERYQERTYVRTLSTASGEEVDEEVFERSTELIERRQRRRSQHRTADG